ncbi:hypothetical protein [Oceanobacillus kimchii]|uniref:hypothetical protein n=1 Tax=Oceanobacillus kimchii TaxID=746691 RepID=UPI00034DE164|nr:hypothetical protein [Oceanobacillus kimchii]
MKMTTFCNVCMREARFKNFEFISTDFNDEGVYKLICSRNHQSTIIIQDEKFEVLFDIGSLALLNGYTIQAVASIAASVERFHEFCIKVFLEHNGTESSEVETAWKQLKNSSERQLGAFHVMYLNEFKKAPTIMKQNCVAFRNKVIHKGYIPTYSETKEYIKEMFYYIQSILQEVNPRYQTSYVKLALERQQDLAEKFNIRYDSTISMNSQMICLAREPIDLKKDTFENRFELLNTVNTIQFRHQL